ncbi:class I SAM-dependent methyltransferase [Tardiphaga sp. 604_B6_N1_1]|uniref:class I SAM-dependent methyltransferase n=1 Tax=Tardiphaga sp. 604_B6_N1_1 TaxID=3240779 RepID=UPI003F22E698
MIKQTLPSRIRSFFRSRPVVTATRTPQLEPAPVSYNQFNAQGAASLVDLSKSKVLVVGCNTGADCKLFIDLGAPEVHGLDVVDQVGSAYQDSRVTYYKKSIEDCGLASNSFDLVFSFATMEHVPDIASGFSEMARVTKPGGKLFCIAAPLWHSPYGHHMGCFSGHPWVHLAYDRAKIIEYARHNEIAGEGQHDLEFTVDYMLNETFFNKRRAHEYEQAVAALRDIDIIENQLQAVERELLSHPLAALAKANGFKEHDMLNQNHRFLGTRK